VRTPPRGYGLSSSGAPTPLYPYAASASSLPENMPDTLESPRCPKSVLQNSVSGSSRNRWLVRLQARSLKISLSLSSPRASRDK